MSKILDSSSAEACKGFVKITKNSVYGYNYEAWHFRYVGIELATILYNNSDWISLEEYLGIDSKYES